MTAEPSVRDRVVAVLANTYRFPVGLDLYVLADELADAGLLAGDVHGHIDTRPRETVTIESLRAAMSDGFITQNQAVTERAALIRAHTEPTA